MAQVNDNDSLLSFLTMAHIFGRVTEEFALSCGAAIGYWQVSQSGHVRAGSALDNSTVIAKLHVAQDCSRNELGISSSF